MTAEIDWINGKNIDPDALANEFSSFIQSAFSSFAKDDRGVGLMSTDFIKDIMGKISKEGSGTNSVLFANDDPNDDTPDGSVVDQLRSKLDIKSFSGPMLAIAQYMIGNFMQKRFVKDQQSPDVPADPKDASLLSLVKSFTGSVLAPQDDAEESTYNAAAFIPQGDELAQLLSSVPEDQIQELSGKNGDDGAFVVYDGTKYDDPIADPNKKIFK